MNDRQWRTVVVDQRARLYYSLGAMKIKTPDGITQRVPLYNVCAIMIVSHAVRLSVFLIDQIRQRNIALIFCDSNKIPSAELVGYAQTNQTAARLREQIEWSEKARTAVWGRIIQMKLISQRNVLRELNLPLDERRWETLISQSAPEECPKREGLAARIYFNTLFGKDFKRLGKTKAHGSAFSSTRQTRDDISGKPPGPPIEQINSALNYGYAVLRSAMTRELTLRGYNPALGLAHCGGSNPLNLTYDLIEPYRPFVDKIVFSHLGLPFDRDFKRELIAVLNSSAVYSYKTADVLEIMKNYVNDVVRSLRTGENHIQEIHFLNKNNGLACYRKEKLL